ncbi:MAG: VanW family protein, partial [Patescibacteria group bacterium]
YYGTPGFDATIYPPYTDFRFLNNTPGYILIQTKIEGTRLTFEFWGTDDNRSVVVEGPSPYNRMPDGSVKSVLKQTVTKDGATLVEDTFYSNYKSPNLFPHT